MNYIKRQANDGGQWYVSAGMMATGGELTVEKITRGLAHNDGGRDGMIVLGPFSTEAEATKQMATVAGLYHPYPWQA